MSRQNLEDDAELPLVAEYDSSVNRVEQIFYYRVKLDSGCWVIDNVNRCRVMVTAEQYGMDAELLNQEEAKW